jgi:hypothetical protein
MDEAPVAFGAPANGEATMDVSAGEPSTTSDVGYEGPITKGKARKTSGKAATTAGKEGICLCGCGRTTGGGRFVAGHDAKLKSELLRAFRGDGLSDEQQGLVERLGWERFMTPAPAQGARKLRDPGELADLRHQMGRAIDVARDRTRPRPERLEAVHWLDKLFRGPLTADADLDAVVAQFDAEAE